MKRDDKKLRLYTPCHVSQGPKIKNIPKENSKRYELSRILSLSLTTRQLVNPKLGKILIIVNQKLHLRQTYQTFEKKYKLLNWRPSK